MREARIGFLMGSLGWESRSGLELAYSQSFAVLGFGPCNATHDSDYSKCNYKLDYEKLKGSRIVRMTSKNSFWSRSELIVW